MMLSRSEHPVDPSSQAVLFYLYTSDLPSLREHLVASGVEVSPIRHPDYMPSGEIGLKDPDGYSVLVCHWTSADHERWLKRVEEKRQRRHHAATPND